MNTKTTAVEWLFDKLWETPKDKLTWNAILEQAKEMEKEQIIEAVVWFDDTDRKPSQIEKQAQKYYIATYE
jgi:hypothetical protein